MRNTDMKMHVRGKSIFIDDIRAPAGLLHAVLFTSPIACGIIKKLDFSEALEVPGVAAIITHKDIPGKNQIGHILQDQPLLAESQLEYTGQPIAIVVADSRKVAEKACRLIKIDLEKRKAVLDPLIACEQGDIFGQKRIQICGDTGKALEECAFVAEGSTVCHAQEHFYFETQRALAIPKEDGTIKVCASAQSPGAYHHHISEILGIPMHRVELEISRLGGAFGGKESSAIWVCAPALASWILNKPVKLVLQRNEDIATTGKRHPYHFNFKIGMNQLGMIQAYEVELFQQAGACADISMAVLGRSFLHATSAYNIPNVRVAAVSCRTNIPPNNAFRGFGVPQAVFAVESAIHLLSEKSGFNETEIKKRNLLKDGDSLPYGMTLHKVNVRKCWDELDRKVDLSGRIEAVEAWNSSNQYFKRGIAVIPVCFGISFAQTALNQAGALVNIYVDGSVSVSTGAVEMGQGVNTKIQLVAATTLGIEPSLVRMETTNTTRVPNASPTSASTGADLNGMAAQYACQELLQRLQIFAARRIDHDNFQDMSIRNGNVYLKDADTGYKWRQLIKDAHWARVDLSSHAFYATPGIYLNRETEKGRPFAYYSYGASVTEIKLDTVRGIYELEAVEVVHDVGKSLSSQIDRGQIEGAVVQAMGWSTMEQLRYGDDGSVLTGASSYKIPDISSIPPVFGVTFLENSDNPFAICNSKAVGEPPYIHGLGAYFAILNALRSIRQDKPLPPLPLTPERVFMYLHEDCDKTVGASGFEPPTT